MPTFKRFEGAGDDFCMKICFATVSVHLHLTTATRKFMSLHIFVLSSSVKSSLTDNATRPFPTRKYRLKYVVVVKCERAVTDSFHMPLLKMVLVDGAITVMVM